jgi:hypothetical protein
MRLTPILIAAAAITALTIPSAFAMEKMDGDAWLKMAFHGKPGEMMPAMARPAMVMPAMPAMPTMPKAKAATDKMADMAMNWPWHWPMAK